MIDRTPGDVVRIGSQAKLNLCVVFLVSAYEKLDQTCGPTQHEREYPAGERIERPCMTDAANPGYSSYTGHDVVRCGSFGLVDDEYAVQCRTTCGVRRRPEAGREEGTLADGTQGAVFCTVASDFCRPPASIASMTRVLTTGLSFS